MKRAVVLNVLTRVLVFVVGTGAITGAVYLAGRIFVPLTDPFDKAILSACNPKSYVPVLDQFIRALTDYTNLLIVAPLLSWLIASLLLRLLPKRVIVGMLTVETVVLAILSVMGKIWPNKTYVGANVLLVVFVILAFGGTAWLFARLERDAIRRLAFVLLLSLFSGIVTNFAATEPIKGAVARPRPLNDANKPWNETVRVIPDEVLRGNNSFPSGHTSGTFSLLTPLFWYVSDRRARGGLLTWATLQGFSRVYTAAHFPFCCLMGGILGFSLGTLIFFSLGGNLLRVEPKNGEAVAA